MKISFEDNNIGHVQYIEYTLSQCFPNSTHNIIADRVSQHQGVELDYD